MVRQRFDTLRRCRIQIAVLDPAIGVENEISGPSVGQRRQFGGIEAENQFISGAEDGEAVVRFD